MRASAEGSKPAVRTLGRSHAGAPKPRASLIDAPLCSGDEPYCRLVQEGERLTSTRRLQARERFQAALKSEPRRPEAHLALGRLEMSSGSYAFGAGGSRAERAAPHFEAAVRLDPGALSRLELARICLAQGRGEEALRLLEVLVDELPDDPEVQSSLGIGLLGTGRVQAALRPLQEAVRLDSGRAERHDVLGTVLMLTGNLKEAERSYRAALALDGAFAQAHGDLGTVLVLQGHLNEGHAHLLRAHRLAPKRATFLSNLAYVSYLQGDLVVAEKHARAALELDDRLASAWLNLGLVQVAKGERQAGRDSFERARSLDPTDPRPNNNLADLDDLEAQGAH